LSRNLLRRLPEAAFSAITWACSLTAISRFNCSSSSLSAAISALIVSRVASAALTVFGGNTAGVGVCQFEQLDNLHQLVHGRIQSRGYGGQAVMQGLICARDDNRLRATRRADDLRL